MKDRIDLKKWIWFWCTVIVIANLDLSRCEIIKFKGEWMMQDHYEMKTGEKIEFDFKSASNNNIFLNNTIYDIQVIDNNEKSDKKYTQLCKVRHMRIAPLYNLSKAVYASNTDDQSQIIDFMILNTNILIYIFSNGKIVIASINQLYNPEQRQSQQSKHNQSQQHNSQPEQDNQYMDIIVSQIYEDQLIQFNPSLYAKMAYHSQYQLLMVYISSGEVFYLDISNYIKNQPFREKRSEQATQTEQKNKSEEDGQNVSAFYQIEGIPLQEKAKKFLILNGHIIFLTINGKVKIFKVQRTKERILSMQRIILDLNDEQADFVDADNHKATLLLLDTHRGVLFYDFNKENEEYILNTNLIIPLEGGALITSQQLKTVIVATQDKNIKEYYIDYDNSEYMLNNEIEFDEHVNTISIEENYLFVSAQSRNSNFFTPLNVLKNTSHNIEQHQTMVKFGQHNIQIKFTMLQSIPKSQVETQSMSTQQKNKKLKGSQQPKEQNNSIASAFKTSRMFIQLTDGNKLDVVPYYYESESLVCSSESTQALLSNVNAKYEYTLLYNSTDCLEKERYYKVEKLQPSELDLRKSYCNSHGTVSFEIDFTSYEKKEFEIWLVFIFLFILSALLCFKHYKNKKLSQMFALKESMSSEKVTKKRKRLNLHYEPLSLLPNSILKQD